MDVQSGRVIAGLGVGVLVMIIPLYQAEIAHPSIRGRLTGLQQLLLGVGACVASKQDHHVCWISLLTIYSMGSLRH